MMLFNAIKFFNGWKPNYISFLYHTKTGVYGNNPRKEKVSFKISEKGIENRILNSHVFNLVSAFRHHGHRIADINPINRIGKHNIDLLSPVTYGLSLDDLTEFATEGLFFSDTPKMKLYDIVKLLEKTYCSRIGLELEHLNIEEREWFAYQFEKKQLEATFSDAERKEIAKELLKSQVFDKFLATKFSNVKRYGAEGAESMITFFQTVLHQSSSYGVTDVVIGIPHRGRLNLLSVLLNLPPVIIFRKMQGLSEFPDGVPATGDVLSHLRISTDLDCNGKFLHVSMLPNPSHLEAISPVVVGKARSMLQDYGFGDYSKGSASSAVKVLPIQVHGDASFTGQGVIMETLAMSRVPHFRVGGCIHLIVNNQLGFTTPEEHGRSSDYCSDVMKMIGAPVIHVNGNSPEDIVKATQLALDYRTTFQKDVLVDLICFRRWGHNEMDDPTFTNPTMYQVISSLKTVPDRYCEDLAKEGVFTKDEKENVTNKYTAFLNENLQQVATYKPEMPCFHKKWKICTSADASITKWDTGVPADLLKFVGAKSVSFPDGMSLHPVFLKHVVSERIRKIKDGLPLDWATAEALAFGSLLLQGHNIRLSGQDVGRGTFSQRHAMVVDQSNDEIYVPLNHMSDDQSAFLEVANSILSEEAVLSFEYGFSINNPNNLVIWEAQFGDFFNSAQVVFDTCISASESKWMLQTGIVILLPHGYDGAGPEHSSCRVERFLQMSNSKEDAIDGDDVNWSIVSPTTPAQFFHLLRKQVLCHFRRPLIVVAPKILLRYPAAVSTLADMSPGKTFSSVITDSFPNAQDVRKIIFCSGKHYYLLHKEMLLRKKTDTAIIRLEELCPFPAADILAEIKKYKSATSFIWSQEEHQNMGAWSFVNVRFQNILGCKLKYVGRRPLAAPAVGIGKIHQEEVHDILEQTFKDM